MHYSDPTGRAFRLGGTLSSVFWVKVYFMVTFKKLKIF